VLILRIQFIWVVMLSCKIVQGCW